MIKFRKLCKLTSDNLIGVKEELLFGALVAQFTNVDFEIESTLIKEPDAQLTVPKSGSL